MRRQLYQLQCAWGVLMCISGCSAPIPYTRSVDPVERGFLVRVQIDGVSDDEHRLIVSRSAALGRTVSAGLLGVEYAVESGALKITRVVPDMPAALAGVRVGDRIIAINGQQLPTSLSSTAARKLLEGRPGESSALRMRRQGAPEALELRITRTPTSTHRSVQLVEHTRHGDTMRIVYQVHSLAEVPMLAQQLSTWRAVYTDAERLQPMLRPQTGFTQYVFRRQASARARAEYTITISFDPRTPVVLGGHALMTNEQGGAMFRGVRLDLSAAKEGIIYLIDPLGHRVLVRRDEAGRWMVSVRGQSLGKTLTREIEVEALR